MELCHAKSVLDSVVLELMLMLWRNGEVGFSFFANSWLHPVVLELRLMRCSAKCFVPAILCMLLQLRIINKMQCNEKGK